MPNRAPGPTSSSSSSNRGSFRNSASTGLNWLAKAKRCTIFRPSVSVPYLMGTPFTFSRPVAIQSACTASTARHRSATVCREMNPGKWITPNSANERFCASVNWAPKGVLEAMIFTTAGGFGKRK